jgi:hypothetical protein
MSSFFLMITRQLLTGAWSLLYGRDSAPIGVDVLIAAPR